MGCVSVNLGTAIFLLLLSWHFQSRLFVLFSPIFLLHECPWTPVPVLFSEHFSEKLVPVQSSEAEVSQRAQRSHSTQENRYPIVYAALKNLSTNIPKILVFGSSTGEEPLALSQKFPQSIVVGVDVDEATLVKARVAVLTKSRVQRMFFFNSLVYPLDTLGTYDMVVANGVLSIYPSKQPLRFDTFQRLVIQIDRVLRPGGILCIVNPNYRLEDTPVGMHYTPYIIPYQIPSSNTSLNRSLCGGRVHPHSRLDCTKTCGNFVPLFDRMGNNVAQRDSCIFFKRHRL